MGNYKLQDFAKMTADCLRIEAYSQAIKESVTDESVVLDLGAGTGILSLLACKQNAKKIYAIEPNPAVQIAKSLIKENNFQDKVIFFEDFAENIDLPEKVDLVLADLRGKLPLYEKNLELMQYAKNNWLKSNGILIPQRDIIFGALVNSRELFDDYVKPWKKIEFDFSTKDFENHLANCFYPVNVKSKNLASEPQIWAEISYNEIKDFSVQNILKFEVSKTKLHGFYLWFDAYLTENVFYSCGIDANNRIYGSVFFPFTEEINTDENNTVEIALTAKYLDENYIWFWNTKVKDKKGQEIFSAQQSTFLGMCLTEKQL